MKQNYVAILKEHIMQNMLGNYSITLLQVTEKLKSKNPDDANEISKAYEIVSQELSGEYIHS